MALQNVLYAPFGGSRTKLTNGNTICEYDGTIDQVSGALIDISGAFTTDGGIVKVQHDLAAANSPTTAVSSIMKNDGTLWNGRMLNGVDQAYSRTHHANFNIFTGNHTATALVYVPNTSTGWDTIFSHVDTNGFEMVVYNGKARYYLDASYVEFPTSVADGKYHVIQCVRSNNFFRLLVDGVFSYARSAVGLGNNVTYPVYIGWRSGYYEGNILYVRLDATALSDAQLEFERGVLLGYAPGTHSRSVVSVSRSSAAFTRINNKLYNRMANIPRIGTDGILIEEVRTNLALYSQTLGNAAWTKLDGGSDAISTDGAVAPDGTTTADGIIAFDNNVQHGVTQSVTLSALYQVVACYAKPGNKNWIYLSDNTVANAYAYFNLAGANVGTVGAGVATGCYGIESLADGWCRCWFAVLGTAAAHTIQYSPAQGDADNDFAGDHTTVNTWFWGLEVQSGNPPGFYTDAKHATSYIATTSAAAAQYSDEYSVRSWSLNTALTLGSEAWSTTFDKDVAGSGTVSLGGKTFTQAGDVKHIWTPDLKHYYDFDGSGDYLTIADSSFNITTKPFTLVFVITPTVNYVTKYPITKGTTPGDIGWYVSIVNATDIAFSVSADRTAVTTNTKSSALYADRTSLVTITYDGTTTSKIYVDGLAVSTKSDHAGYYPSTANFVIGADTSATSFWPGKIHYLARYDGVALTAADHAALYARFRVGGVLPAMLSSTSPYSKIYVSIDAKAEYATGAQSNSARPFVNIAGNEGSGTTAAASSTMNNIYVYMHNTDGAYLAFYDSAGLWRAIRTAVDAYDWSKPHRYEAFIDTANLGNSYFKIDGALVTTWTSGNWSGSTSVYFTNTRIRIGGIYNNGYSGNAWYKNLRVAVE